MKSIVETISKEVVAARESERAGIVTNVYTDDKLSRVRGYKVSDEERDGERMLPLRRVIGDADALIAVNLSALGEVSYPVCPIGAKVYDTCGVLHGILRDLTFDEESGAVLSLISGESEIDPARVLSFGGKVVVLRAPSHEKKAFRAGCAARRRSAPRVRAPEIVEEREESAAPSTEIPPEAERDDLFREYAFLLGRKVRKDILNGDIVVASAEESVTPDVILSAHRNGKLVELTVNSTK